MAHRMELAADVAELGIFVRDEDRVGGEWNAQMYRLFRLDPAQGLPSQAQWLALVHPDDRERMTHSCEPILGQDAGFIEHEYRVRFSDDEVRWMSQRARHETLDGRSVLLGITTDVTERIEAESARRDSLLGEREGHARAELLARINHELRTPLHAVLGFAQMLQHEFADPTARPRTRIDPIVTAGQHLLALINDLLDLSSLQSSLPCLQTEPVSVAEVVREALIFVEGPARASRVTLQLKSLDGVYGIRFAHNTDATVILDGSSSSDTICGSVLMHDRCEHIAQGAQLVDRVDAIVERQIFRGVVIQELVGDLGGECWVQEKSRGDEP